MNGRAPKDTSVPDALELVREALRGLKYGQVVVTVHDGEVAQVERTEKLRPQRR